VLTSVTPCKEKQGASLRKALSPISSYMVHASQQISDNEKCTILFEPQTPIETSKVEKILDATPLDKFNALGSNLKVWSPSSQFIDQRFATIKDLAKTILEHARFIS
jgi:kinesin family protein 22